MSRRTTWREASFAVVDVETTGLDPDRHEVLSVGVVPVDGGRIRVGSAVYVTVRPDLPPDPGTVAVHGIRPVDAAAGADRSAAHRAVADALAGRVLVAHVAWVERTFLLGRLRQRGVRVPDRVVDTDVLTRWVMARDGRPARTDFVGLDEAVAHFGLPPHQAHHALGDALATAQVLLAACTRLSTDRDVTVATLLDADRSLAAERHHRAPNPSGGRWRTH